MKSGTQRTQKALRATQRAQSANWKIRPSQAFGLGPRPLSPQEANLAEAPTSPPCGDPPKAGGPGVELHGSLCVLC